MYLKFLTIRNGYYYFRRKVWSDLRTTINKNEIRLSLKTADLKTAEVLARHYASVTDTLFSTLREKKTLMDIDKIIKDGLGLEIKNSETLPDGTKRKQSVNFTPEDIAAILKNGTPSDIAKIAHHIVGNNSAATPNSAQTADFLPPEELLVDDSPTLADVIEHYKAYYKETHPVDSKQEEESVFRKLFLILRRLTEMADGQLKISELDNQWGLNIVNMLKKIPTESEHYTDKTVPEMLAAVQGLNVATQSIKTSNDYIGEYSALFVWVCNQKEYKSFCNINPFQGLRLREKKTKKNKAKNKRYIFEKTDIEKIFAEKTFTDFDYEKEAPWRYWLPLLGSYTGARPCEITALYIFDIVKVEDMWAIDFNNGPDIDDALEGYHAEDFQDNDKCAKTHNSFRTTPVHSHLIELGFIDFLEKRKQQLLVSLTEYSETIAKKISKPLPNKYELNYTLCRDYIIAHQEEYLDKTVGPEENRGLYFETPFNRAHRLFPELKRERDGYPRYLQEWFHGTVLKKNDIYIARKKVYYSFRHSLATFLDREEVKETIIEEISGRNIDIKKKSVGRDVYISPEELSTLSENLEKLDYRPEMSKIAPFDSSQMIQPKIFKLA